MKKDDRGLSLVELLVAIMILAIVVAPFLHSFVTSARMNQKAKRVMRATSVAENIMEGMRPLSLEQIVLQLGGNGDPAYMAACGIVPYYEAHRELLIEENATAPEGTPVYAATYTGSEWQFVGQDSHVYYFSLTGISQDGERYDARIKLDASGYYSSEGEATPGYNEEELVQLTGLDLSKDALFAIEASDEAKVCAEFAERSTRYAAGGSSARTAEDFAGALTREVVIGIEQNGTTQDINITLTYTAPAGWVAESEQVYTRTMQVFHSGYGEEGIRNIFLLYPPNYNSMTGSIKDIFRIENYNKLDCGVYLIKQVTGKAADLLSREMLYRPRVEVMEGVYAGEMGNPAVTKLYSNFTVNLGKKEMGFADCYMADQTDYRYNALTGAQALEKLSIKDILDKESAERIFHTEVRIYEAGAFDAGTGGFDETKYIVTLEN